MVRQKTAIALSGIFVGGLGLFAAQRRDKQMKDRQRAKYAGEFREVFGIDPPAEPKFITTAQLRAVLNVLWKSGLDESEEPRPQQAFFLAPLFTPLNASIVTKLVLIPGMNDVVAEFKDELSDIKVGLEERLDKALRDHEAASQTIRQASRLHTFDA